MPPLPSVPDTLRIDLHWGVGSDSQMLTRLHYSYSGGPPSAANCVTMADAVEAAVSAHLLAFLSDDGLLEYADVQDIASATGASGQSGASGVGSRSGGSLSAGTSVLLNHQIARRYRGGKPRSYLPFFDTTDLSGPSGWESASIAALLTAWNAFNTAVLAAGAGCTIEAHTNVSYYEGFISVQNPVSLRWRNIPKYRVGGPISDTITSTIVNGKPASQRRRNLHSS